MVATKGLADSRSINCRSSREHRRPCILFYATAGAPVHQSPGPRRVLRDQANTKARKALRAVDHSIHRVETPMNNTPTVLDACCGSRMFWFDRADKRALFVDKRAGEYACDTREGRRNITVNPDIMADFKALPFSDGTFTLVVFDPPHTFSGPNGWTAKKYGTLKSDWRKEISAGFAECFRVLCPLGTLIFKWNEHRIPVSTVLSLTPEKPLFGQRCGTTAKTHWIVFMKPANALPCGSPRCQTLD